MRQEVNVKRIIKGRQRLIVISNGNSIRAASDAETARPKFGQLLSIVARPRSRRTPENELPPAA
jgi:hypothetical protein